jgi:hypothetical protein
LSSITVLTPKAENGKWGQSPFLTTVPYDILSTWLDYYAQM